MFDPELFLTESKKHREIYIKKFPTLTGFALDGPNDSNRWNNQKLKVLFLLKETYGVKRGFCNCMNSYNYNQPNINDNFYSNKTNRNISRLSYGLIANKNKTIGLSQSLLSDYYSSVATIEIKKSSNNTGSISSYDPTILKHAIFSHQFIKWQINELNPDIIVCCGSVVSKFLRAHVYPTATANNKIYKHENVIIINSYHPSYSRFHVDKLTKIYRDFIKNS